jgi:hypothetical protein
LNLFEARYARAVSGKSVPEGLSVHPQTNFNFFFFFIFHILQFPITAASCLHPSRPPASSKRQSAIGLGASGDECGKAGGDGRPNLFSLLAPRSFISSSRFFSNREIKSPPAHDPHKRSNSSFNRPVVLSDSQNPH